MTPHEAKARLLRVVMKLVAPQLEQGGFVPFGAVLGHDIQLLMPESMKQNVKRDELDAYFIQHLRKAIANGKYATACWCADVRGQADDEALIPALLVHLEHAGSFSEDILISYRKNESGKIVFDEPNAESTRYQIFPSSADAS